MEERCYNTAAAGIPKAQANETTREPIRILLFAKEVLTDPDRSMFYNVDTSHEYVRRGITTYFRHRSYAAYILNLLLTVLVLRCRYRALGIELILSNAADPVIGIVVGLVNRITRCRIDHVIWNFNMLALYRGLKRWVSTFAVRHVSQLVVSSAHEVKLYSEFLGIPSDRITFKFYSGHYLEDPRYQNLKTDPREVIISAGSFGRDYGFLAEVAARCPEFSFVVMAYPWALKGIMFPLNVSVIAGVSDVEYCRQIANSRLFLLPIRNTTTASGHAAIIQAMCFRTPLLTNVTEGTKDYFPPGENCAIFPTGDVEAAVEMIRRLWSDESFTEALVQNGYRWATEHFTSRTDIKTLNEIICRLEERSDRSDRNTGTGSTY
jgi:glycosyltransferase involved in cell wall biosynthesis